MIDIRSLLRTAPLNALLALGACDDGEANDEMGSDGEPASVCSDEERADDFAVNLSKTGTSHTVTLMGAEPADPIRGDNAWTVMVTDASGTPMEGLTVDAKPWMPDHGHGSAVEETVTDLGGGEYELDPLNLFMAGFWAVTLEITDADGTTDEVMIGVCVE